MKSTILDVVGVLSIAIGAWLVAPWLGLVLLGIACLAVSYTETRRKRVTSE